MNVATKYIKAREICGSILNFKIAGVVGNKSKVIE
jgi:hypothetical protein